MCRRQHWSATLTPSACYWHAPHLVAQSWYQWQSRSWGAPICSSCNPGWRLAITVTPCWHNRCYLQSVACLVIALYSSKTVPLHTGMRHDSAATQGNARLYRTRTRPPNSAHLNQSTTGYGGWCRTTKQSVINKAIKPRANFEFIIFKVSSINDRCSRS